MNISTNHMDENPFTNKPSGGYEWWYFDAISHDNQWSFVVIFYQGNPFSPEYIQKQQSKKSTPDNHPAVSISVYNRNNTEFYSFIEYTSQEFSFIEELNKFQIGSSSFKRTIKDGKLVYLLNLEEQLPSGHNLSGEIEFISDSLNENMLSNEEKSADHHFWNLIQPRSKAKGKLDLDGKKGNHSIAFDGLGYHDHNVGLEPMKDDFQDWYWGRYHFEDYTLIYYVMNRKNRNQHQAWLISKDNHDVIDTFYSVELEGSLKNMFGLKSNRKVVLKSDRTEITVQTVLPIDEGPFYQRFLGQAIINKDSELSVAEGISEYIYPKNIYRKLFWPAVKMRIRFKDQKPHWVQRFKTFYEWTW